MKTGSRRAPLFFKLHIPFGGFCLKLLHLFGCDWWRFVWIRIFVEVEWQPSCWPFVLLVAAHAMDCTVSLQSLKLILKNVSPAIPSDDQVDFPPFQLVEVFVAVSANLAYDKLVSVVGSRAFFDSPSAFSLVSGWITSGILYHFCSSSMAASRMVFTSSALALNNISVGDTGGS